MSSTSITLDHVFTHKSASHKTCMHWTALGPENGVPLIFIHGTPWSSFYWTPYAKSLSSHFKVYLFDHPGFGESPGQSFANVYDSWEFSAQQPPHIIAHDIGGIVALRANLLHGCRYASLCAVDVVALRPFGSPFFRLVAGNRSVFNDIPDSIYRGMLRAYIEGAAYKPLPHEVVDRLAAPWIVDGCQGQSGFVRQIAQADERHVMEVEERYAEVGADMPVKVIWGKEDGWIPVKHAVSLGDALGARHVVVVDDAGHLIMFD